MNVLVRFRWWRLKKPVLSHGDAETIEAEARALWRGVRDAIYTTLPSATNPKEA